MAMDPKTLVLRRAVVHLAELAMRMEHERISEEDRAAMEEAAQVLDANRRRIEWNQMQAEITFLVENVLAPIYEHVQAHPEMTVAEVEARIVEDSSRCGFDLSREVLDDVVLLADEINGKGAVKAAAEAVGEALGRDGRTILRWKADAKPLPPNMGARSGTRAANILVYVAGLLRLEAAADGRERLVERLSTVIQAIVGPPAVAPPPDAATRPCVPPEPGRHEDVPD